MPSTRKEIKTPVGTVVIYYNGVGLTVRIPRAAVNIVSFEQKDPMDVLEFDLQTVETCIKAARDGMDAPSILKNALVHE